MWELRVPVECGDSEAPLWTRVPIALGVQKVIPASGARLAREQSLPSEAIDPKQSGRSTGCCGLKTYWVLGRNREAA